MNSKEAIETARCMKESLDTENIIEPQKQSVTMEDESISMIDTIHDLEQENMQLKQQLTEKDKVIENLYKILDSQRRHINNMDKYFRGRGTRRTGNVILDFELLIRHQVCDEIREFIDNNDHSEENEAKQSSESAIYTKELLELLDKVEKGE